LDHFSCTFVAVLNGIYLTLAPELTLENSGELATGPFYAGIPHPPAPVWTIYTWCGPFFAPLKTLAAGASRFGLPSAGAAAAGLLALLVHAQQPPDRRY